MPAALCVDDRSRDELDEFGRALEAAGQQAWASTLRAARTFRSRVDRAGGWDRVELDTPAGVDAPGPAVRFVAAGHRAPSCER